MNMITYGRLLLLIGLFGIIHSCQWEANKKLQSETALNTKGISLINYDDDEMIDAIKTARTTFHEFESFIDDSDDRYFAIKIGILYPGGKEHLWVADVVKEDSVYYGRVDNQPEYTDKVKLNDIIAIPKNIISDWMVIENNQIIAGGYTLKLIRNRMTPEEQKAFDEESQLIFDSVK